MTGLHPPPLIDSSTDFFTAYLQYCEGGESPNIFHRWSAITCLGALLGKRAWITFGSKRIHPNMYTMFLGVAGSRKSTAILQASKVLALSGYKDFSANKSSKEKFLMDLAGIDGENEDANSTKKDPGDSLDYNLFGDDGEAGGVSETFIVSDEFNDFFGNNNLEFISLLGTLWDWDGPYRNRIKHGKSFTIPDLCISMLGGNTPTTFAKTFPPEIIGQGFFSRVVLIYSEPTGRKVTFPPTKSAEEKEEMAKYLREISVRCTGEFGLTEGARELVHKIYQTHKGVDDVRFESYSSRRLAHLLKLCIIHTASRCSTSITALDVLRSNTVLHFAELRMPKALGEFGKARNSDVTHKIMLLLDNTDRPLTVKELWRHVSGDMEKFHELGEILRNLQAAEKIQVAGGGFLRKARPIVSQESGTIEPGFLTGEERNE